MEETPFHFAANNGNLEMCNLIINNIDEKNPKCSTDGNTFLHMAATEGNLAMYQLILDNVDDKNPKNNRGDTPFHLAAKNGNIEICKMLLDTFNVLGKNLKIEALATLIDKVADNGHFELIQWINDNINGDF